MNKRKLTARVALFAFFGLFGCLLSSCSSSSAKTYSSLSDFSSTHIGAMQGSAFATLMKEQTIIKDYVLDEYTGYDTMVQAVYNDKVAAFLADEPVAKAVISEDSQHGLSLFPDNVIDDHYGFAFRDGSPYVAPFNTKIKECQDAGITEELKTKWVEGYANNPSIEDKTALIEKYNPSYTGNTASLHFGASGLNFPMWYLADGSSKGYDAELAIIICIKLNYSYEFTVGYANTGALISAIQLGSEIDAAGGSISITSEREEKVDFTIPTYNGGVSLVYKKNNKAIEKISDLNNRNIGFLTGSMFYDLVKENGIVCNPLFFSSIGDCIVALKAGKIDAYIDDSPSAIYCKSIDSTLRPLEEEIGGVSTDYAFVFNKSTGAPLQSKFNEFLAKITADGTKDKLVNKWLNGADEERTMDYDLNSFSGPTLHFVTNSTLAPFTYLKGQKPCGYEVELAYTFSKEYGYTPKIENTNFDSILPGISTGTYDIAFGSIGVSEERKENFLFSDPDYTGYITAVVSNESTSGNSIADAFYKTFVKDSRYLLLLQGYGVTILITVASAILGTILGFLISYLLSSKTVWLRGLGRGYVFLMQGVPIVVILMILFYVIFAKWNISSTIVAIIGFSLAFAAEAGEIIKSGLESVDPGETEASISMGFSRSRTLFNVSLPQAIDNSIGVYMNSFTALMKNTSVVGYIAIIDLTRASDLIRSQSFEAFVPLLFISLVYLLTSILFFLLTKLLKNKVLAKKKNKIKDPERTIENAK